LVQGKNGLAYTTWTRLHRFFLDNMASCHLYLSKAFQNTPHGDMSIATYASKLQSIADDLATIGHPVDDGDLTLQFVDGLGKKFKLEAEILMGNLPSFADACSLLQLTEVSSMTSNTSLVLRFWSPTVVIMASPAVAMVPARPLVRPGPGLARTTKGKTLFLCTAAAINIMVSGEATVNHFLQFCSMARKTIIFNLIFKTM
jgi:hypothetical protein